MKISTLILAALTASLVGCATTSSTSAGWALITNAVDPVTATAAPGTSKTGEACVHNVLGLIAFGDASIEKAKKAAALGELSESAGNALGHVTPKDPAPAVDDPAREVSNRAVVLSQKDKISLAEATALVLATDKHLAAQYWGQFNA